MSSTLNFRVNNFLNIFVISLPLFFALGPALIEITSFIFLIFFIIFYLNKNYFFHKLLDENKNLIFLFLLFWLILIISSFGSEDYYLSFKNTGFYFRFLTFSLLVLYCLKNYKQLNYIILYVYFFLFAIIFPSSIYEVATGKNFFNNMPTLQGRITSIFLDEQILGSFIAKSLPLILGLLYFTKIKYKPLISLSIISISLTLIFLSGERTAFALFLIFIFLALKIKDLRKVFYFLIIVCFSMSILFPKLFNYEQLSLNRLIDHTVKQVGIASLGKDERIRIFSPVHEYHYIAGIKMFLNNPVLGIGPNNFRKECKKDEFFIKKIPFQASKISAIDDGYFLGLRGDYFYFVINNKQFIRSELEINPNYELLNKGKIVKIKYYDGSVVTEKHFKKGDHIFNYLQETNISGCNTHPHNYIVQFLTETGILGFIFYISLICFLVYKIVFIFFSRNYKNYSEYFILISIFLSLFPFLPSGNFFNNMNSFIIFWNLPFYIYFKNLSEFKK